MESAPPPRSTRAQHPRRSATHRRYPFSRRSMPCKKRIPAIPGLPLGAAAHGIHALDAPPQIQRGGLRWFDRDRFVLSAGHGSMLLYALLYLTGYPLTLRRSRALSPTRQQDAGPSRAAPHARRRGNDGTARSGARQRSRACDRRSASGRDVQPRADDRRSLYVLHRQRRRSDGRRLERSELARRPSAAR